jgi:hypothetical protein
MSLRAASRAVSQTLHYFERRLDRMEIYYTVWFNAKFLKAIHCLSCGKPQGIKPDSRIKSQDDEPPRGKPRGVKPDSQIKKSKVK